jgi:hypothetical protein
MPISGSEGQRRSPRLELRLARAQLPATETLCAGDSLALLIAVRHSRA